MSYEISKSDEEWRQLLTEDQFRITRKKGTEPAFSGKYHDCKEPGVYLCICCAIPLFDSGHKFDSGTGWPSFNQPIDDKNIAACEDRALLMRRTEVLCARCGAHLGHVFEDGPAPTELRFCINSASLKLEKTVKSDI
ncbi:MAG: peptide-methionine (R)-S-oxide reductase MsrB [Gammaproteobacteria bacterium]|nr:MAG: peptide-methionine (R)-S-oxide reductase MsrB [Gammaproteobacteria bacterium]